MCHHRLVGNFYTDTLSKSPRFHSTDTCNLLSMLYPPFAKAVKAILADAKAAGVVLTVFETYRSTERQELLFKQRVTQLQHVGVHHYGLAADIVHVVNGQPSWAGDFSLVGRLAVKHGLIWGGDWGAPGAHHSFIDEPHVQYVHVDQQQKLFSGEWYPV